MAIFLGLCPVVTARAPADDRRGPVDLWSMSRNRSIAGGAPSGDVENQPRGCL